MNIKTFLLHISGRRERSTRGKKHLILLHTEKKAGHQIFQCFCSRFTSSHASLINYPKKCWRWPWDSYHRYSWEASCWKALSFVMMSSFFFRKPSGHPLQHHLRARAFLSKEGVSLPVELILWRVLVSISHCETMYLLSWFISVNISLRQKIESSSLQVSGHLEMLEVPWFASCWDVYSRYWSSLMAYCLDEWQSI